MKTASTLIVIVSLAGVLAQSRRADDALTVDVLSWFESYRAGQTGKTIAAIRTTSAGDAIESALKRSGANWMTGRGDGANRRLIVGAVLLEYAAAHRERWDHTRQLLEWACAEIRTQPKSDPERVWHLGVATLAIALGDPRFNLPAHGNPKEGYLGHVEHAGARFPGDPAFQFVEAEALEQLPRVFWVPFELRTPRFVDAKAAKNEVEVPRPEFDIRLDPSTAVMYAGQPRLERRAIGQYSAQLWTIVDTWKKVAASDALAAKAHLHAGNALRMLAQPDLALQEFASAEHVAVDVTTAYLARLFAAQVLAAEGRRAAAIAALRSALVEVPRAQSASFLLASLLFAGPRRAESIAIVEDTLREPLAVDPYRSFDSWDLFSVGEILDRMRGVIR